ncbi:DNA-3-methyladenine glycosylase family protein [Rudanella lutea]|uniref:DNA-3-methyladenine glycosylase family protein n=1 Tax=Rudanella lutea TaxID=451374 RepID=UPI000381F68A|nr:DNA-3-methyladenine glycosylase [Rudanella lutea]
MIPADAALSHLANDPVMGKIIAETPLPKAFYDWNDDVYLALLESIVSQQISVKAADAIFRKFRLLFLDPTPAPDLPLSGAGTPAEGYPDPVRLLAKTPEELRSAGLSFQKIGYLRSVAEFALANRMDRPFFDALTDEEVIHYLIPIKGVGRWTVEMLLMFVLDRPDVLPVDDLVIRQKMVRAYGLTETGRPLYRRLHEIAEPWRPYRTLACRYLWRWQPRPVSEEG